MKNNTGFPDFLNAGRGFLAVMGLFIIANVAYLNNEDMKVNGEFYKRAYFNPAYEQHARTSFGRRMQSYLEEHHLYVPGPFPKIRLNNV